MKKVLSIILLAVLLTTALSITAYAETGVGVEPGQQMPGFTVPLTDGTTATLSELLKEKDLVVLNIFASWCKPCEREFPEMERVYQANWDRMEIISVSGDHNDTMEVISAYKESHALSFPMGLAGDGLSFLTLSGFPTTILIDRSGAVGLVKVGAFIDGEEFENKVNHFLSPDYNGKPLEFEKAINLSKYIFAVFLICGPLRVIGRWGIFRKAGKKGWHSLIPILNAYEEYSTVWNGWFGVLVALCLPIGLFCNLAGLPSILYYALLIAGFLIRLFESLRLAKAFGKSKAFGVLMAIPVLKEIGRLILGLGRTSFRAPDSDASAA